MVTWGDDHSCLLPRCVVCMIQTQWIDVTMESSMQIHDKYMQKSYGNHCVCCSYEFCVNYTLVDQNFGTKMYTKLFCIVSYIQHSLQPASFMYLPIPSISHMHPLLYTKSSQAWKLREVNCLFFIHLFFFVHGIQPITCTSYIIHLLWVLAYCLLIYLLISTETRYTNW